MRLVYGFLCQEKEGGAVPQRNGEEVKARQRKGRKNVHAVDGWMVFSLSGGLAALRWLVVGAQTIDALAIRRMGIPCSMRWVGVRVVIGWEGEGPIGGRRRRRWW